MKKKIYTYGEDVLRNGSRCIESFDKKLHKLIDDMYETMYDARGVGLAAPQVGIGKSLCVIDSYERSGKFVLINPEIISGEGESVSLEGCLSVPEISGEVKRFEKILVQAQDIHGKNFKIEVDGFLARIIQHETDHLNGILFVDRLSPVRKVLLSKKLKRLLKQSKND